jgi:surfactin synthase thioesterase subunit
VTVGEHAVTGARPQELIGPLRPARDARIRLLCLPQAGAGTAGLRPLAAAVPGPVDVCAVRLPGREGRRRETPYRRMDKLVDDLMAVLRGQADRPLALLGYCSGAFVAFDLARRMTACGSAPVALFACAAPGPQIVDRTRGVHQMPRSRLVAYLREYEITPELILGDESVFEVFEPAIRADFELFEAASYVPGEPLGLPISVIGGRDDRGVDFAELLGWRELTSGEFAVRLIPGGHDFMTTAAAAAGRAIGRDLDAVAL